MIIIKKVILVNIIIFISNTIYAQAPAIQWQKSFGGSLKEASTYIEETSDGGYIITGMSMSNDGDVTFHHGASTIQDWWIVKVDNSGAIQWQKSFGGSESEGIYCIKQTSDGGYILGGDSFSNNGDVTGHHGTVSTPDAWVVKLSSAGSIVWQKSFGGTMADGVKSIKETSDGNFVFVGASYSNDGDVSGHWGSVTAFNGDIWVVKLSNTGTIIWQNSFGGSSLDYGSDIVESSDGGFAVVGISYSTDGEILGNHGNSDGVLFKLNATGVLQWGYSLGGSVPDSFENIKLTADNGFVLVGSSGSSDGNLTGITGSGQMDTWLLKTDSVGGIQWTKLFGGSVFDHGGSVEIDWDGGFIIGSTVFSNDLDVSGHHGTTSTKDFWVTKTDNNGNIQWEQSYGGSLDEKGYCYIRPASDGGYIGVVQSYSSDFDVTSNHGDSDCWVVKLEAVVGINENNQQNKISVIVYPNPSLGEFNFSGLEGENTIEILDVSGRVIDKVKSQNSSCLVDLSEHSKGLYFYKVTNDYNISQTGKIVLN